MCFIAYFKTMLIRWAFFTAKKPFAFFAKGFEVIVIKSYSLVLVSSPAIESRMEVSAIMFLYFM